MSVGYAWVGGGRLYFLGTCSVLWVCKWNGHNYHMPTSLAVLLSTDRVRKLRLRGSSKLIKSGWGRLWEPTPPGFLLFYPKMQKHHKLQTLALLMAML